MSTLWWGLAGFVATAAVYTLGVVMGRRLERRNELARRVAVGPVMPRPALRDILIGATQEDAQQHQIKWLGETPIATTAHRLDVVLIGMPVRHVYLTDLAAQRLPLPTLVALRHEQAKQPEPGRVYRLTKAGKRIELDLGKADV